MIGYERVVIKNCLSSFKGEVSPVCEKVRAGTLILSKNISNINNGKGFHDFTIYDPILKD